MTTRRTFSPGQRFGRWTLIRRDGVTAWGRPQWLVQCECGTSKSIEVSSIARGDSASCGCLQKQVATARWTTHGLMGTRAHACWKSMKARCLNPLETGYKYWGGRGITICEKWLTFEGFFEDMGEAPEGMTIGRRDNDGNYEPGNCRWETQVQQQRNRRSNRRLSWRGETLCVSEWSERLGISRRTIQSRLADGWDTERSLATPARRKARSSPRA